MDSSEFKQNLDGFLSEIYAADVIELEDIPSLDLYMDQVTTLIETAMSASKRNACDKVLTKTMINNYVKEKIFPPPIKKKYAKNHIMLLIIIYNLKATLSISDIKRLLAPITNGLNINERSERLEALYSAFNRLQKNYKKYETDGIWSFIGDTEDEELRNALAALYYAIGAQRQKRMAEKLLDKFF